MVSRLTLGISPVARASVGLRLVSPVNEAISILSRREIVRVYLPFSECKLGSGVYILCVNNIKPLEGVEFAYNIDMKPSVGTKLPRLPPTNPHAWHYEDD